MIYLDYSATTPVNKEVLESFDKVCLNYPGNPNSLHKLGVDCKNLIDKSTEQIQKLLNTDMEVIYTSGSSESNNLVIKGVASKYSNRGKHIITTPFEHSSINSPLSYLVDNFDFTVDFVKLDENGLVDLDDLKKLITNETILVSVASVNSEIGIRQPIEEIAKIVKGYPKCFFHSDMTQSIGKINIPIDNIDFISFTSHKFFGLKGIGVLLKGKNIIIDSLIHGGKATTVYRSGTPAAPLIVSFAKALRLALENQDEKVERVMKLNKYLKEGLAKYPNVHINSNDYCIPHIVNFSVLGVKPETMQHALENYDIYISTQSACSSGTTMSKSVYSLTHNEEYAKHSVRISISYVTTKEEIDKFFDAFSKCYKELV